MEKRVFGFLVDWTIYSVLQYFIGYLIIALYYGKGEGIGGASFELITLILFPMNVLYKILIIPEIYQNPLFIVVLYLILFLIQIFVFTVPEIIFQGSSFGNLLAGIKVVNENDDPCNIKTLIIRNTIKALSIIMWFIFLILFVVSDTTLQDYIMKTKIVSRD